MWGAGGVRLWRGLDKLRGGSGTSTSTSKGEPPAASRDSSPAREVVLTGDELYKARWECSDFGRLAIRENLAKVQDRRWVVSECRTRVCPTQGAMEAVLLYGLVETERYRHGDEGDGGEGDVWWFRYERLRLLQRKDRLETFLGMHNGRWASFVVYRLFLLLKTCCELGFKVLMMMNL